MFSVGPCPSCGFSKLQRSRRNLLERTLGFFLLPWRCHLLLFPFFTIAMDLEGLI